MNKAPDAFRTISEVAEELDLPQHVLRFWESRFPCIKPLKRGGGRRFYRPEDIDLLRGIRRLLYRDGYTIKGVQRILRERGVHTVQLVGQGQEMPNPAAPARDDAYDGDDGRNDAEHHDAPAVPAGDVTAVRPQNGLIPRATLAPAIPVERLESGRLATIEATGEVAASQLSVDQAVTPVAVRTPPAHMTARDLDRLKHALAELEACRRLLDKAVDGTR